MVNSDSSYSLIVGGHPVYVYNENVSNVIYDNFLLFTIPQIS